MSISTARIRRRRLETTLLLSLAVPVALLPSGAVVGAQGQGPPKRAHHALQYDPGRQRVVLTGGSTPVDSGRSFTFFDDLWEFDGARWAAVPSAGAKLSGMRLAYDGRRQRLLSFGGFDGAAIADLRELERDGRWRTIGTHAGMPVAEPGFVYDANRDRFVAFGGSASRFQTYGETWEYDGSAWHTLDVQGPPARQAHGMVYDSRRGRTVLFGGMGSAPQGTAPPMLGDLWEFDGRTWIRRDAPGPSARVVPGMTYDSRRGLVILFGGFGPNGNLGDTWSWDGTAWKKLADSGPPPRSMGYLAYDPRRDRVVLFGGRAGYPNGDLDDTWEWDGMIWREWAARK